MSDSRHTPQLDALSRPLRLRGVTLPNRPFMSAMTLQYGADGLISDRHLAFYRERARGEVGLVLSEQLSASDALSSCGIDVTLVPPDALSPQHCAHRRRAVAAVNRCRDP